MVLTLSVLDQSPVRSGVTALDAIEETVKLAQTAEVLGYAHYWLAEHHGTESLAGCSPEVLLARIGAVTCDIRIGAGGVMLSHYSPLKVGENFALLSTMYPGRVDLSLGRAPGGDQLTVQAMLYGSNIGVEYYPAKVLDMKSFLFGGEPANKGLSRVTVTPLPAVPPELWLLGSSVDSVTVAAMFGLRFSFAHFINPTRPEGIVEHYRQILYLRTSSKSRVQVSVFSSFVPRQMWKQSASLSAARYGASCLIKGRSVRFLVPRKPKPTRIRTPKSVLLKRVSGASSSVTRFH